MRVLMVAPQPFFRPRGTPFSVFHRVRALVRLGHTVDLVTYPFGASLDLPGLVIHRTARPPGVRDVLVGPSVAKVFLDIPLFVRAYRLARTNRFDLLHTHEEAGVLGSHLARTAGLVHLYDMHSSLPQQFSNFNRFNWRPVVSAFNRIERYILAGSHGVIAICPELEDHVLETGFGGPVAMIENTLDFDPPAIGDSDIAALRARLGVTDATVVLYAGTLEAYQGLDLLISAAEKVVACTPSVRFVLVGGNQTQIDGLRERAVAAGVQSCFVFVPAVPPQDVFSYHRLADVLVTTRSKGTNTPLKLYQYLRAGKPIVATRIRSHTQVLTDACAELVAPTAEGIANGLLRVLGDPEYRQALSATAARLAKQQYGEETYMSRLRDLLDRMGVSSTGHGEEVA